MEQGHCTLVAVKRCWGAYAFANGLIFGSILHIQTNIEITQAPDVLINDCNRICILRTHKTKWFLGLTRMFNSTGLSRTWKVTCRDQKGGCDSVEQAHCTLGAVKRYRALVRGWRTSEFFELCSTII